MTVNIETVLLEEASKILKCDVRRDDALKKRFNINKMLAFMSGVHDRLGIELDVNSFYIWPTLGALAKAIVQNKHHQIPKLLLLRAGNTERPLIVFAGGVNCFLEIKTVIDGCDHDGAIYGMCLTQFNRSNSNPATMADEVEACHDELTRQDVSGEISLMGFSFGGLVALDFARDLQAAGRPVRFLGLIDVHLSEHAWPFPIWAQHVAHRIMRRLGRLRRAISTLKPKQKTRAADPFAGKTIKQRLLHRFKPILFRFCDPALDIYPEIAPQWVDNGTPEYLAIGRQLLRMKGLYRPSVYTGNLVFYRAMSGSEVGCEPRLVWDRFWPNAEWVDIPGTHISAVVGKNGTALGRDIARRIDTSAPHGKTGGLAGHTSGPFRDMERNAMPVIGQERQRRADLVQPRSKFRAY